MTPAFEARATEGARWRAAFPTHLAADVLAAQAVLPLRRATAWTARDATLSPDSIDSRRRPRGIVVDGEPVVIPYRLYTDQGYVPATLQQQLTPTQRTILDCIYTRHHDGHLRQAYLRKVIDSNESWVVPFVVQMIGEYVVQIMVDIWKSLDEPTYPNSARARAYTEFVRANAGFMELTTQRVHSYWDCYFRRQYLSRDHSPGYALLARLPADSTAKVPFRPQRCSAVRSITPE